jgi:solute carrier family 66, member 2
LLQFLIGHLQIYVEILGFLALAIEATLPIPQFISHYRRKSVAGFRLSVLVAWLLGDFFKTSYFILGDVNITWQFRACAVIQSSFDVAIAFQFWKYGDRQVWNAVKLDEELEEGMVR